jgi:dihydroxyacetone kinase phosphotransfer subunit
MRALGGSVVSDTVGIVIVSHSQDIAKGTADMVRQMVGGKVKVAFCGGNPDGGLGANVPHIVDAIETVWSPMGVAILVDLGGAEINSEMAVEMLPPQRRDRVVVCNAPIVEGAVMAATEAAGGSPLEKVRSVAEELSAS